MCVYDNLIAKVYSLVWSIGMMKLYEIVEWMMKQLNACNTLNSTMSHIQN